MLFFNSFFPYPPTFREEGKDLDFWGGQPSFVLQNGSDETWCAWTDNSLYGIGLYTPVATKLLAGRFMYDGSKDSYANSTNYVAPLADFKLNFDESYTYTYYLTAGSVTEIRNTFQDLH